MIGAGWLLSALLSLPVLLLIGLPSTLQQPDPLAPQLTVLYDGRLSGAPGAQGFSFLAFGPGVLQEPAPAGGTELDTLSSLGDQAGYFSRQAPILARDAGYSVLFTLQLKGEEHLNENRAGWSMLVIGDDLMGIELGFWQDEIWAQAGDGSETLFTHAEGTAFNTDQTLGEFELRVSGDNYQLIADGVPLLSGPLRSYTTFDGFPDPYETANLVFMGDNTTRAGARTLITYVAVESFVAQTASPTAAATNTATAEPSPRSTTESTATIQASLTPTPVPPATRSHLVLPAASRRWTAEQLYGWFGCLKGIEIAP